MGYRVRATGRVWFMGSKPATVTILAHSDHMLFTSEDFVGVPGAFAPASSALVTLALKPL
jgi:hypothetical protein